MQIEKDAESNAKEGRFSRVVNGGHVKTKKNWDRRGDGTLYKSERY